jgi:hypothetical protein
MKTILVILLFVAPAFAQINPTVSQGAGACGPLNVQFDVQTFASLPTAGPESGKALVYVVDDSGQSGLVAPGAFPTLRVGLDGAWEGATRGSSYLYFSVDAGEHHLCTNWQSRLKRFSQLIALARLTAEPGRTYYFRERITVYQGGPAYLDLERLDPDEGSYLVSSYRLSKSHSKK